MVDWSSEPALMSVKRVAPLLDFAVKSCWHMLEQGRFPIRHVAARPYRFISSDVRLYVEKGVITNPLLLATRKPIPRRFFGKALRAVAS